MRAVINWSLFRRTTTSPGVTDDRVERSRILFCAGPQQRSAIAQIAGPGSDRPCQHAEACDSGAAQNEKPVIWNQRGRVHISVPAIACRQPAARETGSSLLRSRSWKVVSRCSNSGYAASARRTACARVRRMSGSATPNARGRSERSEERQTCSCNTMRWKGEMIQQQYQCDCDNERRARKDRRTTQPRSQPQPLLQSSNIGIELDPVCSCFLPLRTHVAAGNDVSASATTNASSITYHHRLTRRYLTSSKPRWSLSACLAACFHSRAAVHPAESAAGPTRGDQDSRR